MNKVVLKTYTGEAAANRGEIEFDIDETVILSVVDNGLNLAASKQIQVSGTAILSDNSGTMTLSKKQVLLTTRPYVDVWSSSRLASVFGKT